MFSLESAVCCTRQETSSVDIARTHIGLKDTPCRITIMWFVLLATECEVHRVVELCSSNCSDAVHILVSCETFRRLRSHKAATNRHEWIAFRCHLSIFFSSIIIVLLVAN